MTGILSVSDNEIPQVITNKCVFNLNNCKLTKHANGNYNFNMSLDGKYTAYKEGDIVSGMLSKDKTFIAWSLVS
ncbi:MAG: hypothetical protein EKK64_11095 [Neisseriaceae bacterium]|nr:MAG: hypothetical protein EKK64_11095 [Neisseriaceae bacterium]